MRDVINRKQPQVPLTKQGLQSVYSLTSLFVLRKKRSYVIASSFWQQSSIKSVQGISIILLIVVNISLNYPKPARLISGAAP